MDEDGEDRRDHPRALTDLEVSLTAEGGVVIDPAARALDVSPEGFRVVTKAPLEEGSLVNFSLSMDDGGPIAGTGEIAWCKKDSWGGTEGGVRILNVSWADSQRLRGQVYQDRKSVV